MFYDNLKKICDERKTSISAVAKSLNLDKSIGTTWKRGVSPTGDVLIKLSNKLDCSVDYLLGRTDNINSHKEHSKNTITGSYNIVDVDNSNVAVNASSLDEHQKLLIDLYNQLSPIEQINLITDLSKANEKTATKKP